jgi:uncharacterized protein (DUF1778 family)
MDMVATTTTAKRERLEARISPEQKALFQRAADLTGRSLTDFVVSSVQAAAEEAIERHQVIRLSARDSLIFAEAILNPAEPNEHLRAAAERYRKLFGDAL